MDFFKGSDRYLPEDDFDGGGTRTLPRVMLVSKAMHHIIGRCHNLWAVFCGSNPIVIFL
jgi:hypothetical protein